MGNAQKLPSGPDKRLAERFALSPDGGHHLQFRDDRSGLFGRADRL
jgi:hypothetical protein